MSWETFAIVLHLFAVVIAFMLSGILHAGLFLTRASKVAASSKPWPNVIRRLEPLLALFSIVIFGSGVWLIALFDEWLAWTDGWMLASIVALLAVQMSGPMLSVRERALFTAIEAAPADAAVTDEMRPDTVMFMVAHVSTTLVLGILYLMIVKPSGVGSIAVLAVAIVLGVVSAIPFRTPKVSPSHRAAPTVTA